MRGPLGPGFLYDWTGGFAVGLGVLSAIAVGLVGGGLRLARLGARRDPAGVKR